ncbi:uncharacterized protein LOC129598677 [Paramacrobiotus metropolitanus]|uniref:uncharacterized protein LOC129598677 n=1 Tax=Paramacrobiotus metropolitanus TaxID=2943436 RepID=UPI0024464389|nr:uncharacterized protein LOC129598677 [Paramacrobiotus metropolitanus]
METDDPITENLVTNQGEPASSEDVSSESGAQDTSSKNVDSGEPAEPAAKKVKLDVVVPEDYQEDDEEFPADWKETANEEEEEEEEEGFNISLDEVKPRIDYRKALLNKKNIDFNDVPEINGVPVTEFNIDTLEDKPWKKPGVDISDYFNYGFNEDSWRLYCDKQRRMRSEAQTAEAAVSISTVGKNDNSKYIPGSNRMNMPGDQSAPGQPFRAQFRRRQPDGQGHNPIQVLNDRKPEGGPMMGILPGGGMPFPVPNPGMMGAQVGMGSSMMMRPLNDLPPQQRNFPQNPSFASGGRRQLTTINLTAPASDNKESSS